MDSEIVRLTLDIREQKPISYSNGNEVKVMPFNKLSSGMLLWADQILTATNRTRIHINDTMRQLTGHEGLPQDGDKIICLRNYWDCWADNGDFLVNGTIGYLNNPYQSFNVIPPWFCGGKSQRVKTTIGHFTSDVGCDYGRLQMDTE